jgi:hypothetical protein
VVSGRQRLWDGSFSVSPAKFLRRKNLTIRYVLSVRCLLWIQVLKTALNIALMCVGRELRVHVLGSLKVTFSSIVRWNVLPQDVGSGLPQNVQIRYSAL